VGRFADPLQLSEVIAAELGIRESVRLMVPTITIGAGVPEWEPRSRLRPAH